MKLYWTSDWHLGHNNILKFCDRPFKDVDEMAEKLISNYNSVVPKEGLCYFLGDMGMSTDLKKHIDQLNGTKVLIIGNHDKNPTAMYDCGFDVVLTSASIQIGGRRISMSHCPLRETFREDTSNMKSEVPFEYWYGDSRKKNEKFTIPNYGQHHLHGHIHSPNKGQSKTECGLQLDVGVDAHNYTPLSFKYIQNWVWRTNV